MFMQARFENDPGIQSQYDIKGLSHEAFGTDQQPYYFQPKYPSQALGQGQFTKQSGQAEIAGKYGLIAQNQYQSTNQQPFAQSSTQPSTQQRGQTSAQMQQPTQQSTQYNQPVKYQSGSQYIGSPQSAYMTGQMGGQTAGQQTSPQPGQGGQTMYGQSQGTTPGAQNLSWLSQAAQDFIGAAQSGMTGTYVPGQTTGQPTGSQYQPSVYQQGQSVQPTQQSQYYQPGQYQTSSSGTEATGQSGERYMLSRHRYGYGTEINQPAGQPSSQGTMGTQTGTQSTGAQFTSTSSSMGNR
jgi:hypothetical protein